MCLLIHYIFDRCRDSAAKPFEIDPCPEVSEHDSSPDGFNYRGHMSKPEIIEVILDGWCAACSHSRDQFYDPSSRRHGLVHADLAWLLEEAVWHLPKTILRDPGFRPIEWQPSDNAEPLTLFAEELDPLSPANGFVDEYLAKEDEETDLFLHILFDPDEEDKEEEHTFYLHALFGEESNQTSQNATNPSPSPPSSMHFCRRGKLPSKDGRASLVPMALQPNNQVIFQRMPSVKPNLHSTVARLSLIPTPLFRRSTSRNPSQSSPTSSTTTQHLHTLALLESGAHGIPSSSSYTSSIYETPLEGGEHSPSIFYSAASSPHPHEQSTDSFSVTYWSDISGLVNIDPSYQSARWPPVEYLVGSYYMYGKS